MLRFDIREGAALAFTDVESQHGFVTSPNLSR